jgi:hypothetical protein
MVSRNLGPLIGGSRLSFEYVHFVKLAARFGIADTRSLWSR